MKGAWLHSSCTKVNTLLCTVVPCVYCAVAANINPRTKCVHVVTSEHTGDWEVTGKCTKDLHILLCCPHLPSPPAHRRLVSLSAGLHTGHIRQRPSWYQEWQCVDSYRSFNVSSFAASARGRKRHHCGEPLTVESLSEDKRADITWHRTFFSRSLLTVACHWVRNSVLLCS